MRFLRLNAVPQVLATSFGQSVEPRSHRGGRAGRPVVMFKKLLPTVATLALLLVEAVLGPKAASAQEINFRSISLSP